MSMFIIIRFELESQIVYHIELSLNLVFGDEADVSIKKSPVSSTVRVVEMLSV